MASILNDLDVILDSAVYGVPVPGMDGKCGMAAIVLKDGAQPTEGTLTLLQSKSSDHV